MGRRRWFQVAFVLAVAVTLVFPGGVLAAPLAPDTDLSLADTFFEAEGGGDRAGYSVAALGDVNGDGLPDYAVGAPQNDEAFSNGGQVYVIFGRPGGWDRSVRLFDADASFLGETPQAHAGNAVAGAGDVNNDGFDDILIGAYRDKEVGLNAGQVYLILGKDTGWAMDTPLSLADASFLAEAAEDEAGTAVAGVGDVNGDGFDDILIGAPKNDYAGERTGQAYLIFGKDSGWSMDTPLSGADASFFGESENEHATFSLAGAGDVNGDGLDDILIGDWSLNNHVPNGGEAYLIYGKETGWAMRTPLADSDASFMGEALGNWAGYSLDGVGDVNGDGFGDFVIGATGNDDNGRQNGEAYLFLGNDTGWASDTLIDAADASFRSEWWGYTWNGSAVTGAGDINGDGLDDFLVAASIDEESGLEAGQIYVVLGRTTGWMHNDDLHLLASFRGEDAGDQAGKSIAGVGDVNADGMVDLLVGAPYSDYRGTDGGRAYLLLGNSKPATGHFAADRPFRGLGVYHTFSASYYDLVDGWEDLSQVLIQTKAGGKRTAVRYRPATEQLWLGEWPGGWLGVCRRGQPGTISGTMFELDCEGTTATNDGAAKLEVGWRLRVIGDVSKPFAIKWKMRARDMAHQDSGGQHGGSWVVNPGTHDVDLSDAADDSFLGEVAWDLAGWDVASAGDVNNDGLGDILVGAPKNEEASLNGGQVYLFLGNGTGWGTGLSLADADASFTSESQYDYAGLAVDGVGDVNGDGFDDFVIGAYSNEDAGITGGKAYLILGKASGWIIDTSLSLADASFLNEGADYVGWSVAGAGDANGDGFDDFLIGAWGAKGDVGQSAGVTFLVLGKASGWAQDTLLSEADASFVGEAMREWASYSIAGAGDVNGDGFDDFVIGAPQNSEAGTGAGQAYLILGKETGWAQLTSLSNADASFRGVSPGELVGMAVSGAGDVNGDGFDDLLVDAWGDNSAGGPETGQAYLFFGKASGWAMDTLLSQADASFVGEHAYDRAGQAMAPLGDINNDSYDDLAIASPGNDDGGAEAGKVYIILGQETGWTLGMSLADAYAAYWGEERNDRAGNSVAGAAGVLGTGSVSLLVGAPANDEAVPGDYNAGKTYHVVLREPDSPASGQ